MQWENVNRYLNITDSSIRELGFRMQLFRRREILNVYTQGVSEINKQISDKELSYKYKNGNVFCHSRCKRVLQETK